jgi:oligopeptide transport system permease protein
MIDLPTLFKEYNFATWILPVLSLSLFGIAGNAMWLRRFMVDESNKDYVLLARAKGVPPAKISRSHIFRNAIVPLVQYIPGSILFTLMGSLYVESLYSIPGMGGLLVDVIKRQDNTMVQALVLIFTALSIGGLLLGDILMALVDPRITLGARKEMR